MNARFSAWFRAVRKRAALLKRDVYALYFAYRDPRLGWGPRLFAACVAAYAFSPIDLIPDFVPVLGYLDDLVLIPAGVTLAVRMIPPEIMADARGKAASALLEKKPVSWAAGAAILLVWLGLAGWIAKTFLME